MNRFKDVDAEFSSFTVLNWVHRHIQELDKLDVPLCSRSLSEGSLLFCDETTEPVKVLSKATGKFEYCKKYIGGIKNPIFNFLLDAEWASERWQRSIPILSELWQILKPTFDETKDLATTLFIKTFHYAVNEWEAVCRYVNNGQIEIDNNAAERIVKPVCLGRNYLFCGSE